MTDCAYKGRLERLHVAFAYALTTGLVSEAVRRHDCDPPAAHVFGRALTAGVLAASPLSPRERLNVRWSFRGRMRDLVVDAGPDGSARGLIAPPQLGDCADKAELWGDGGEVRVIRSEEGLIRASGTVQAVFLDVVADLAFFLSTSDQVESAAAVMIALAPDPAAPVRTCRGLLLQALPGADLELFPRLGARLHEPAARARLGRVGETDNLVEDLLRDLARPETPDPGLVLEPAGAPRFVCGCGPDKLGAVVRALPYGERVDIVQRREPVVVTCHFCRTRYTVPVDDCIRLWNQRPA